MEKKKKVTVFSSVLETYHLRGVNILHSVLPLVKEVLLGTISGTSFSTSRRYLEDLYYGFISTFFSAEYLVKGM